MEGQSNGTSPPLPTLEKFITQNLHVKYIRFHWVDYSGVLRGTIIPLSRCLEIAASKSKTCLAQSCLNSPITVAERVFCEKPERWVMEADWNSLKMCGFRSTHASVMCFLFQEKPEVEDGSEMCPRKALQKALRRIEHALPGTSILLGFEIEFMLLSPENQLPPILDRITGEYVLTGLRRITLDIIEEVCDSLKRSSIEVYSFKADAANQIELDLSPLPVMEAIDSLMLAQETIRTVANLHGLKASMFPRPISSETSSGLHVHISLNPPSEKVDCFLSGILSEMKALCAFSMAHLDSYFRSLSYGAGHYIGWGTENRDLPIRKISNNRWEFRALDSTANVYLALAALLSAASHGVTESLELRWKDCPLWPTEMTQEGREKYGITEELPSTLQSTLQAAEKSDVLKTTLGSSLLNEYIRVKKHDLKALKTMSEEERRVLFLQFW